MALSNRELMDFLAVMNKKSNRRRFCIVCRVNDRKYFLTDYSSDYRECKWTRNTADMVVHEQGGARMLFDEIRDKRPHGEFYIMDAEDIFEAYPPKFKTGDVT